MLTDKVPAVKIASNNKRFHAPSCYVVDKNRGDFRYVSKERAVELGATRCQICGGSVVLIAKERVDES